MSIFATVKTNLKQLIKNKMRNTKLIKYVAAGSYVSIVKQEMMIIMIKTKK